MFWKTILFLFLSVPLLGQESQNTLKSFFGYQEKQSIKLEFVIRGGHTCFGIDIYRSLDSVNFETVGRIPGVCGNSFSDEGYEFIDTMPLENRQLYYRLYMGGVGYSEVVSVEYLSFNKQGYSLLSNPHSGITKLIFKNPNNQTFELKVYDLSGRMIHTERTTDNFIWLNAVAIKNELVIFQLQEMDGEHIISGKVGL